MARSELVSKSVPAAAALIVAPLLVLAALSWHERKLLREEIARAVPQPVSRADTIVALTRATTAVMERARSETGMAAATFRSLPNFVTSFHVQRFGGGCGATAAVLARLLSAAEIRTRFGQIGCEFPPGSPYRASTDTDTSTVIGWGCHIFLEARVDSTWAVLEPLYRSVLRAPSGRLASAEEARQDWRYYRPQLGKDFGPLYRYDLVRYTNWEKVPVVLPTLHAALLSVGVPVDELSLRTYVIDTYRSLILGLMLLLMAILLPRWIVQARRKETTGRDPKPR